MPLTLTRKQCREVDHRAITEHGIPSIVLMENAARACADEAERLLRAHGVRREMDRLRKPGSKDDIPRTVDELARWKADLHRSRDSVVVLCGPGNNGGDGFALARTLANRGHEVRVYFVSELAALERLSADTKLNARLLRDVGVELHELATSPQIEAAVDFFRKAPLIVDALFGTGLTRTLEDPFRAVIQHANEAPAMRLAVDIPSGLDADTGDVHGVSFRADSTITFVAAKPGFYRNAGPAHCGKVLVAEIGIPYRYIEQAVQAG